MIVTCPACSTRYHAVDDTVGNRARRVRCVKCAHEWVIDPITGVTSTERAAPDAQSESTKEGAAPATQSASVLASGASDTGSGGAVYLMRQARRPLYIDLLISALAAILVLGGIVFGLWHARVGVVRTLPSLAGLYRLVGVEVNAIGMEIRGTKWRIEDQGGVPVLIVSGKVANISKRSLAVPRLRLVLRDGNRHELYHWTVSLERKQLKPGEFTRFSTTLKNPPLEAHDVEIHFAPQK